ncbi:MAG TPA: rubrerythrin family protein [Candidatus Dorea gallistercoris]|uniref:Rubrerythrin family protein n=1 Tax=Candidatus Dorea gallistercoris TaxID=2838542 RepID=A0A9D1R849_9FIRM|nr:rubrerythrin family protein [Candidatus Dorea gallistercoris]
MAVDFKESRTRENLMRAFAGESQARNRYTIAAETAREQGLFAVNQIFLFTADQERAHAKRFYDLLKNLSGTSVKIDGSYPVDHFDGVIDLLKAAEHNEMEEAEDVYQAFGEAAREEGFLEVSSSFLQIARIEAVHGKRFGRLAEMLEANQYFESHKEQVWMCLNCGHIYHGKMAPQVCPVCRHPRGYFIPACLAPYLEPEFMEK